MKIDSYILLLFYPLLLIDSINGFFLLHGSHLPVSQTYKLLLIVVIVFRLSSMNRNLFFTVLLFMIYTIVQIYLSMIFFQNSTGETVKYLINIFKFLLFVFSFLYLNKILESYPSIIKSVRNVVTFNFIVVIFNLVLGLAGYGFPVYSIEDGEVSIGVKGFFFAGNEISGVFIILAALMIAFYLPKIKKPFYAYASLFVLFLFSATLATKSAIGAMFLLCILVIFLKRKYLDTVKLDLKNILTLIFTVASISSALIYFFIQSAAFQRMSYYYENLSNILRFILSSRDAFLAREWNIFTAKNNAMNFIMGGGRYISVEMDLFDTFFSYGIVGIIIAYGFYFFSLFCATRNFSAHKKGFSDTIIYFTIILVFVQSFISGHILYSGMASVFHAAIIAIMANFKRNRLEEASE
jgi:hypothetical protein